MLADPKGSILADYVRTGHIGDAGSWLVEGIGEDFVPPVSDLSRVTNAYTISDGESFATARALLKTEGLLAGSSSGTLIAAALHYCREQTEPKRVVTFVCDSATNIFQKCMTTAGWPSKGCSSGPPMDTLRDLISRLHDEGAVVTACRTTRKDLKHKLACSLFRALSIK